MERLPGISLPLAMRLILTDSLGLSPARSRRPGILGNEVCRRQSTAVQSRAGNPGTQLQSSSPVAGVIPNSEGIFPLFLFCPGISVLDASYANKLNSKFHRIGTFKFVWKAQLGACQSLPNLPSGFVSSDSPLARLSVSTAKTCSARSRLSWASVRC